MWFVIVMALGGVANHVLSPNAGHGMGYLAIAIQFGFAFAFPVSSPCSTRCWPLLINWDSFCLVCPQTCTSTATVSPSLHATVSHCMLPSRMSALAHSCTLS